MAYRARDSRPVWLLDVDGVLNAPRAGWSRAPRAGWATGFGQRWRMQWEPAVIEQIRTWHVNGAVEVRWCTTWCPDAEQIERLFGLPAFARTLTAQQVATVATAGVAKLAVALTVVEVEQRPMVWTDDLAVPTGGPNLARIRSAPAYSLLIRPDPRRGLRREDMAAVAEFLDNKRI